MKKKSAGEVVLSSRSEQGDFPPDNMSRRKFGKLLGLASVFPAAGFFAGCGGGGDSTATSSAAASTGSTGSTTTTTTSTSYAISSDAKVTVSGGEIQGTTMSSGVRSFLGVPFAAPPVGNLRWKAPQPVVAWSGTKATQTNPPVGIFSSAAVTLSGMTTTWPASEDCLYMNIWVPPAAKASAGGVPVLVFIHGSNANISETRLMGDELAKRGIIVVNSARRQSIFGALALAGLSAEAENKGTSGNFALLDEIAALQWVHDNIAKFGGDPGNVTLSGQSQGSAFVTMMHASPLTKGLFKRVFTQTGYNFPADTGTTLAAAQADGAAWMAKFGTVAGTTAATSVADLRAKTTTELFLVAQSTLLTASLNRGVVDGYALTDTVTNLTGKNNDVPVLHGWCNEDQGAPAAVTNLATYNTYLSGIFGTNAGTVFNLYPAFNDVDAVAKATVLATEKAQAEHGVYWARLLQTRGTSPVYLYRFDRGNTAGQGARHGWDNPYWKGKFTAALPNNTYPYQTAADYELSNTMMDSLVSWCTNGNPSTSAVTVKPYYKADQKITVFDVGAIASVPVSAGVDWLIDNASTYPASSF